jgi:hypothetical protein
MTTYYLSYDSGSDSNNGTSTATPWKTTAKITLGSFLPGDQILFKRGEFWSVGIGFSSTAVIPSSGAAGNPIVVGAYGTGADPIIDGNKQRACLVAYSKNYITIQNLDLRNGLSACALFEDCTYITVTDCNMSGSTNDCLRFWEEWSNVTVTGGSFHGARNTAGIVDQQTTGIEFGNGGRYATLTGVECYDNPIGISIHNHNLGGTTLIPRDITIVDAHLHDNTEQGLLVMQQDDYTDVNLVVQGGVIEDNYDGVRVKTTHAWTTQYVDNVTLDGVTIRNNTNADLWLEGDRLTVRDCIVEGSELITLVDCHDASLEGLDITRNLDATDPMLTVTGTRTDGVVVDGAVWHDESRTRTPVISVASGATTGIDINDSTYYGVAPADAAWVWGGTAYDFAAWRTVSGQDADSFIETRGSATIGMAPTATAVVGHG